MGAVFVLIGLAVLAMPVALILSIVALVRLRADMDALRKRVSAIEAAGLATTPAPPTPKPVETPRPGSPAQPAQGPEAPAQPPAGPAPWPITQAPDASPLSAPRGLAARGLAWLQDNWFYAVAAASLALAGLFLVDYGIDQGWLTPAARVIAALGFGAALIAGGEAIRRRWGDAPEAATAYLPSVLSGAGLVSVMGAMIAARQLYHLIAPGTALAALFAAALGGLALGWRHGPLLAAVGLIGGMAAPFVVGGQSDTPELLLGYVALLTALGLGIDTLRRWAWVSALALGLGVASSALLAAGLWGSPRFLTAYAAQAGLLAILAILIPARALTPDQAGPPAIMTLRGIRPAFPTWLALGGVTAACGVWGAVALSGAAGLWWVALWASAVACAVLATWSRTAPALQDQATLPAALLLALIALPPFADLPLQALTAQIAAQDGQTETRLPLTITLVLLAATLSALAAFRRSLQPGPYPAIWAAGALLLPPLTGLGLEITWQPARIIGAWPWALHALALGALATWAAERYARADGSARLRPALASIAALACLSFALGVVLTQAALTLALGAVLVAAAALDRRFDLPPLTGFIAAGVLALGARLLILPGLPWAETAPVWEVALAYPGTLAALLAARHLLVARDRPRARIWLDSAAWPVAGLAANVLLFRALDAVLGSGWPQAHWQMSLYAAIWTAVALGQMSRLRLAGPLRWLRLVLAAGAALVALGYAVIAVIAANPLQGGQSVAGPALVNTLLAYLAPGAVLALGAWRLAHLPGWFRRALAGMATALAALWAGLVLRHGFRGAGDMGLETGVTQPELYAYTVALVLLGAVLFWQAIARRSDAWRRGAVAVIALAVAKVFLVDVGGLTGLTRVLSFLLLGLSLAGLAGLNRWAGRQAA